MQIATHPQSGAADFTILTEVAKITNLTFYRDLVTGSQLFSLCYKAVVCFT